MTIERWYVFKNRRDAEKNLKWLLEKHHLDFRPSDESNPLVKKWSEGIGYGESRTFYKCVYCDSQRFKAINIKDSRIEYIAQEPIYKIPPEGAKDLKILVEPGIYGWVAIIGPHDIVCTECGALIEHSEFRYLHVPQFTKRG